MITAHNLNWKERRRFNQGKQKILEKASQPLLRRGRRSLWADRFSKVV